MTRAGHYVRGRHYTLTLTHQARARAKLLAEECDQPVKVRTYYEDNGESVVTHIAYPRLYLQPAKQERYA